MKKPKKTKLIPKKKTNATSVIFKFADTGKQVTNGAFKRMKQNSIDNLTPVYPKD